MKVPTILLFVVCFVEQIWQIQQSTILNKQVLKLVIVTNSNRAISNSSIITIYRSPQASLHASPSFRCVHYSNPK
jgi:hypothetical protein